MKKQVTMGDKLDGYMKLSQQEIEEELGKLKGWKVANGKLNQKFEFKSFVLTAIADFTTAMHFILYKNLK